MSKANSNETAAAAVKSKQRRGEPVDLKTPDFLAEQAEQIRQILPHVFTEGKIDIEKLRAALGDSADERPERYSFTWAGKRGAIQELQKPTWGTLVPAKSESVNFDTTQNIFIEGENLEVLKLLYKSYFGRVKLVYIDPPYNTGGDFVYPDNFSDPKDTYLRVSGQKDDDGNLRTSNPESSGRYHSAWLSMIYPRLFLARQLLRDDGVIFVSIDDHEVFNLRLVMNEIFGEENFLATFVWKRRASSALADKRISVDHEYVLAYQRGGFANVAGNGKDYESYSNPDNDPNGDWTLGDLTVGMTKEQRPNQFYDLVDPKTKRKFSANPNRVWAFIPDSMKVEIEAGRVVFPTSSDSRPMVKRYRKNLKSDVNPISTWIRGRADLETDDGVVNLQSGLNSEGTRAIQDLFGSTVFNYSKPPSLISSLIEQTTAAGDIVLDFFAGSGTTGQAIWEVNSKSTGQRKFLLVQLPEPTDNKDFKTIADITKQRLRLVAKSASKKTEGELPIVSTSVVFTK